MRDFIKKIIRKSKKEIFFELIVCIVLRAILLINPILYSETVNYISDSKYGEAINILIIYIISMSIYKLFEYIRQRTFYSVYSKLYKESTSIGMQYTNNNSIFSLSRFTPGEYLNIMGTDIDIVCSFITNGIYRIVQLLEFLVIYYYFFNINITLFFITISFSIIVLTLIIIFGNKIQVFNKERKDNYDKKTSAINDFFNGIKEIKGFNLGKSINNRASNETNKYLQSFKKYSICYYAINIITVYIFEILRLFVFIYGVIEISKGNMELGVLLVIYSYYQKIIDNFSLVSTMNLEYKNVKMSLSRINKLFEYAKSDNENKVEITEPKGKIDFSHVLYGYRHDPVLNDFTIEVKPNTITAITGKTGSGKTGVFDLLMKMNRQIQGSIMIDDLDISIINDTSYYNVVSIARKNPFFFNSSIKDNLTIIGKETSEIEKICKSLGIHETIMSLEKGYDTVISNSTKLLSSSDKKLLAIARVLIKDTKIFLFDEIIEALDKENRDIVMKILKEKKKDHTIMIISRDKNILKQMDNIVLIDAGKVEGIGNHEELSKESSLYKEII